MSRRVGRFGSRDGNALLYGCAGIVVLGIIGMVAIGFLVRGAIQELREQYTSTEAKELPIVQVSDDERDATIKRVNDWVDQLESEEAANQLVLTERDLNVIIQHHDELTDLSDVVYLTIEDSTVKGDMSIPLEKIPGFSGRYFNGSATFEVSLDNNRLEVYAVAASVRGESLPERAMSELRLENLAKELHKNAEHRETIEALQSIEIANGTVILTPKGFAAPEADEPAETDPEVEAGEAAEI